MYDIYNIIIITILHTVHVVFAYLGTMKGEKLNEPESDLSPICQKKKKNDPNGLRVSGPESTRVINV